MNINQKITTDYRYTEQQKALKEICNELNLYPFYSNYHAKKNDCDSVLIYDKQEYVNAVDKDKVNYLFCFANEDINGNFDLSFGVIMSGSSALKKIKLDFRGLTKAKDILKNAILEILNREEV
jgi:hypothetical protein